ncbi:type III-A CRISPR-associated RAMP protein Csm5 [Brachyspira intermedia]|uniref:type III-A CRISPR-associated RAMP protein Csm5 n=1 Tax=Brachyspira intermedia TaxID=84377 RepID=UPI0030065A88
MGHNKNNYNNKFNNNYDNKKNNNKNNLYFNPDNLKLKNFHEYKITVKTLTPVFVGSGEELNKTMHIYDNKTKKVLIVHKKKLYNFLKKYEDKKIFEKFSEDCIKDNFTISNFLDEIGCNYIISDFINGNKDDDSIFKYFLEYRDNNVIDNNNDNNELNVINTFMKSSNVPYIPGSSIKGAIRTAIIADSIIKNKDKLKKYIEDKNIKELSNLENKVIEEFILKDKKYINKNKLFNSIHVSDSDPIPIYYDEKEKQSNFFIGNRYDYSLKTNNILPMSIQLEFLKPNTLFTFYLSIDKFFSDIFNIEYILNSLNQYFNIYKKTIDLFSDVHTITKNQYHAYKDSENANIFIGGHNGYFTKNILYSAGKFSGDNEGVEIKNIAEKIKKHIRKEEEYLVEDYDMEVSPRTLRFTKYDGLYYDIGICSIEKIEEIKI